MAQGASGFKEDRKKVLKNAFLMASGTLTSRILGLFRDVALGALFDRSVTDAWTAAFRLPNLFRRLLGEGSLSVSFIPVFMEAQAHDPQGVRARNLTNSVYSLLLIVLGALSLLGIVFIEPLFRLLLSDTYIFSAEKWELTLRLGRIMFGFVFFVGTYAFYMGLLNALGSFGLPALAPALLNVSMLVFTFLPPSWFPGHGDGLAWGVLVGGILQALVLAVTLRARGYLPQWRAGMISSESRAVFKRFLPGLIGMGLLQFSTLVNLYYASTLPEGAISSIYWADRLLEFPLSLISVSLGAALLPKLSQLAAEGLTLKFRETAEDSFLMNVFLALPAALGLYFLAEPIIEVLFLRGKFTQSDLLMTATVLKVYSISLIFISCSRVLMPLYYAHKNTWFPMALSLSCLLLHVLLAPFFMRQWGLEGLMLSGLFAAFVNALMLLMGLSKWSIAFNSRKMGRSLWKFGVCGGALALLLSAYRPVVEMWGGPGWVTLILTITLAVIVYFGLASLLRCDEFFRIRPSSPLLNENLRQKE